MNNIDWNEVAEIQAHTDKQLAEKKAIQDRHDERVANGEQVEAFDPNTFGECKEAFNPDYSHMPTMAKSKKALKSLVANHCASTRVH